MFCLYSATIIPVASMNTCPRAMTCSSARALAAAHCWLAASFPPFAVTATLVSTTQRTGVTSC